MLPFIEIGGVRRPMGCLSRQTAVGAIFAPLEEAVPVMPRAEWRDISLAGLVWKIIDQDGIGSCNGCAAVQSLMLCRRLQGLPEAELSSGNLYGQINDGRDQGSLLGDALQALQTKGVCTVATVGHLAWQASRWPAAWKDEAPKYRILEAYDCPTFDHIATAILRGFFVDYGVLVGSSFAPDANGFIPEYRGGGGGHAMCGVGLAQRNGRWYIETVNSWGAEWGNNGICYVPESYFKGTFNDAWAVRAAVSEIEDL